MRASPALLNVAFPQRVFHAPLQRCSLSPWFQSLAGISADARAGAEYDLPDLTRSRVGPKWRGSCRLAASRDPFVSYMLCWRSVIVRAIVRVVPYAL
jgi:hypothetical protein